MENLQNYILGVLEYSDYLLSIDEFERRNISVHVDGLKVTFKFLRGEKIYYGGDPTTSPADEQYLDDYWFILPSNYTKIDIFKGVEDFCSYLDEQPYFTEEVRF